MTKFLMNLKEYSEIADRNDSDIMFTLARQALNYVPRPDSRELAGMNIIKFMRKPDIQGGYYALHHRWAFTDWDDCHPRP